MIPMMQQPAQPPMMQQPAQPPMMQQPAQPAVVVPPPQPQTNVIMPQAPAPVIPSINMTQVGGGGGGGGGGEGTGNCPRCKKANLSGYIHPCAVIYVILLTMCTLIGLLSILWFYKKRCPVCHFTQVALLS